MTKRLVVLVSNLGTSWYNLDEYTPCQPTCGDSTQQRLVACVEEGTQSDTKQFSAVANKFCLNPMPKMLKVCISAAECPALWGIGSWEKCSVSCNGGLQRRWLGCQKVLPDGNLVNVSDTECADIPRQRSIRVCNSFPCQKPRIKEPVKKFFQLTHSMAINIFTGSHAYVLPATVLTVRCLTRGIDRSSIRWFRNGKPLVPFTDLRVKYSRNSLHRIKVQTLSTPNQSENYTCRCNTIYNNVSRTLESTVVLHLISLIDILRETAHRESYLLGTITSPYANVTDPADKRPRRAYYVNSQWSSCTASTCKRYGRQTRNVSCEIITTNYFEELPVGVCKRGRLKRPEVKRKCRMDCFKWITYEWGKCHPMSCIRDNMSIQRRRIVCYDSMSHSITRRRNCDNLSLPPSLERKCSTPLCRTNWVTATSWKKCHGQCGSYGVQTRSLWCLWEKTGLPAKNNCYNKLRPLVKRTCKMPLCKHGGTNQ
ncbi:A disintegrin and metalloproteinase with thrombospondin motifs 9 [Octopus bimaculoides]|uniref:A disintegrin and metalloproteinase with thrombospondin motifs 9 n=1 Tax=Octopus bimaculoides TaxID=37653 RepID=UPI0022E8AE4A|nr:A disintegrin and metalloproteinase with thrombospondin motifs 9 [Octopus bimaculoides]